MNFKIFQIVLILICSNSIAQSKFSNHNLIVFKTFEDYVNKTFEDKGKFYKYSYDSWGGNRLFTIDESGKEIKINTNEYWGFIIGDYLFRMNKYSLRIPLCLIKQDQKLFYIDGYLMLNKAVYNIDSGTSIRESDGYFYSDNLNSEIFEISKFISKEKKNLKFKSLIECLKKAKKRYGYQSKFNGYSKCLLE